MSDRAAHDFFADDHAIRSTASDLLPLRPEQRGTAWIAKRPRWPQDSCIVRFDDSSLSIKIHPDVYPIAAHIYSDRSLIEAVNGSGVAARIRETRTVGAAPGKERLRVVLFEFVSGQSLKVAMKGQGGLSLRLRSAFEICVAALLDAGIHPLIKDLTDFQIVEDQIRTSCVMTDHNAMIDCRYAHVSVRRAALSRVLAVLAEAGASDLEYRGVVLAEEPR